jgi:hypothetical protein
MADCNCPDCAAAEFPLSQGELRLIYLITFMAACLATWAWWGG